MFLVTLTLCCALLLLDQGSKRIVRAHAAKGSITLGPLLKFRLVTNRQSSYTRSTTRVCLVLTWLAALLSAILLHRSGVWLQSPAALFGVALAISGAAGNLLDILRYHCVVDFIDVLWLPVFNFADMAIISGLALAVLSPAPILS